MPIGRSIRRILIYDDAVLAIIVARVYPVSAPQNATLPYIVYQIVGSETLYHADNEAGLQATRMQIDCYAETYDAAYDLADKVRLALSGYTGLISTILIRGIFLESQQDLSEPTVERGEKPLMRISADYEVWHDQTVPT